MRKTGRIVTGTIVALTLSGAIGITSAQAANFTCRVNPSAYLAINGDGMIYTSVQDVGIMAICSVSFTSGGVTPDACRAWYSALLTWRATGKSAVVYFDASNSTVASATGCSSFAQWTFHAPYHFEAVP